MNYMDNLTEQYLQNLQAKRDSLYEDLQDPNYAGYYQAIAFKLAEVERELYYYMSGMEGV